MTPEIRRATPDDFSEIARLAPLLWDWAGVDVDANDWRANAEIFFAKGLKDNSINCFVAPHSSNSTELAAYGIGVIYQVMPAVWIPTGRMGYLQWFITEPDSRRQGLAEGIARQLIGWFEDEGISRIQLHSTDEGKPLYSKLGFEDTLYENLWLRR